MKPTTNTVRLAAILALSLAGMTSAEAQAVVQTGVLDAAADSDDRSTRNARRKPAATTADPFEQARKEAERRFEGMGMGMDMGMGMEGGMMGMGGEMGEGMDEGMGEGMEEEMGMMGMMSGPPTPNPDAVFRRGLQLAISQLRDAKTPAKKDAIRVHIRNAFQNRYDSVMEKRQHDLDELNKRVADLQVDLQRRVAARDRVINLQLQSVELTAEGLMQIDATPKY